MNRRVHLRKITDYRTRFRCAGGIGIFREEVWVNPEGKAGRYNLTFVLPHVFAADNGRVLGFDNAHGEHERHYMGKVKPFLFTGYAATARRFYREAATLRRTYED